MELQLPSIVRQVPCRLLGLSRWAVIKGFRKPLWRPATHLHDISVASDEAGGEHPERDHGGEVERGDASTHSKGHPGEFKGVDNSGNLRFRSIATK